MPSYALNAAAVPAVQVPAALLNPSVDSPTTYQAITAGDTVDGLTKHNANCVRSDNLGRYGGGGRAVASGLELTDGGGLSLAYSAGVILADGTVYKAAGTLALADNSTSYLWISQGGAVTPVVGSTTPPAGTQVYLGRVVTLAAAITDIDYSGRVELKGGYLWRRTNDAGAPGDAPSSAVKFWHQTAGALYFWDGTAYQGVPPIAASYVVIGTHNALTAERTLTAGDGLALTDGGAGGAATLAVSVDNSGIEINADTLRLKDLGVTTAKLADDAVTAAKLADDAATDANRAVTTNHIRDLAVTTGKLADSGVTAAKLADAVADGAGGTPTVTAGAEAADVRRLTLQATDLQGNALAGRRLLRFWLADASYGAETGTAPSGGVVFVAGASLQTITASKQYVCITDAAGQVQIDVTHVGAITWHAHAADGSRIGTLPVAFA